MFDLDFKSFALFEFECGGLGRVGVEWSSRKAKVVTKAGKI